MEINNCDFLLIDLHHYCTENPLVLNTDYMEVCLVFDLGMEKVVEDLGTRCVDLS